MTNEKALAVMPQQQQTQWGDQQLLATIRETVCKGATDAQFRMFIEICKGSGLNPFLKEIWFVPSVGVMAGRDGYLRVANQHPMFDGMETRVERDDKNVPVKAVCTVWRKDRGHPIIAEAYYNEYKKAGNVWQSYPSAMIAKVAEVLALKRSFAINGVVSEEEIGPQGSKSAQDEYLRDKGIDPLPEKPKRGGKTRGGIISFDGLKRWGEMKKDVIAFTGDDALYYSTLKAYGYEHADEIKSEEHVTAIWKLLGAAINKVKADQDLEGQLSHASEVLDARTFADILKRHECETIADVMALGGDPLAALLADLRFFVDEKKTKSTE